MSLKVTTLTDPDGTLRYLFPDQDVIVRVLVHRRNGTKKCPVELLHQADLVLATDSDLRQLRDVETLNKHANTLRTGPPWHEILTAVAADLPEHAPVAWEPVSHPLSSYAIAPKTYLWYPWLSKGEPTSLEGDPNAGKTAILMKIIAHLTSGRRFPTLFPDRPEQDFPPQTVLLFTYEDDPHTTLHPRLLLNGGNPALVEIIEGKRDPDTKTICPLTLQDLPLIDALLRHHRPALMCFDPMQSFLGPDVDMNRANETRPVLDAIRNLGKAYACTPLYVRHNGKTQRTKGLHAALGSIDITANMRSSLVVYTDPDDPAHRILAHGKKNGRPAPSLNVKLVGVDFPVETDTGPLTVEEVRVDWDGLSALTADDLNARETVHGNDTEEANSALEQAREFVREILHAGPQPVDEIRAQAKKAGVSEATLRRAKDKERVRARRVPLDGIPSNKWPWEWSIYSATIRAPKEVEVEERHASAPATDRRDADHGIEELQED
jgi:hypothetical protein